MKCYGVSDVGMKRLVNQDSFVSKTVADGCVVSVVCDGMGGAAGGGIASSIAKDIFTTELCKELKSYISSGYKDGAPPTIVPRIIRRACASANSFTYELSKRDPALKGMGTTLVSAVLLLEKIYICNIGDSRAYGFSQSGFRQLTKDHSVVQELVDSGKMTLEEAMLSENKNIITRAVGVEKTVKCDIFQFASEDFDYLMLCTDGLTNYLSGDDMHKILYQPSEMLSFERKVRCLIDLANDRGGKDNVTAFLIDLKG